MNNFDRYDIALESNPREAAALALEFADGCGSKNNAWNWAERAKAAAAEVGVTLDGGSRSWPDTEAMRQQLRGSR